SMRIQMAMLQLDTRAVLAFSDEAYLHFRTEVGVVLPVRTDVPGEHQPRGRFPCEHAAPVAGAAVFTALVPAATYVRLDHRVHRRSLPDLVRPQRPPRPHLPRKPPPRYRWGHLHTHNLSQAARLITALPGLVHNHRFRFPAASRSSAALNAASVSSQNPS